MAINKIPPSDIEIATDSFRVYRHIQKKHYKNLMKVYRVWMRIASVLIIICAILFSLTQQKLYIWMSMAYLLTGVIASIITNVTREMYHRYYKLEASDNITATSLEMSECKRKSDYVVYCGRKYPRVGCKIEGRTPGFILVSCDSYAYIVEVTECTARDLLLA